MTANPGTVHALHGLLGSGKSTLARQLEAEYGALRFTPDEWTQALLGANPPEEVYRPAFRALLGLFEAQWTRAARQGVDVILDYGLWRRADRDALRAVCARHGLPLRLYDLSNPPEVLWARVSERNGRVQAGAAPDSVWIHEHDFQGFHAHFEPLDEDEARVSAARAVP